MARYLITGGAGFIGSALAVKLIYEKHEVHVIDLESRLNLLKDKLKGAHLHCGDVSKEAIFAALPADTFDIAFHMAAQTSARVSEENPNLDINSNVKGTYYFCKWARENDVKRAVFTSSMAVYGAYGDNIDESEVIKPTSVYGITKAAGEFLFRNLIDDGVNISIFRLFNVYGPGQDYKNMKQGMLSIFLTQALTSDAIRVTGSPDRYRDFIYIDDVLSALLINIDNDISDDIVFNVGNGIPVTVKQLCTNITSKISKKIGKTIPIIEIESHRGDVFGNYSNSDKLLSLGWKPIVGLDEGIESTLTEAFEVLNCK
jgi:UDP-glucose 4-epimerase